MSGNKIYDALKDELLSGKYKPGDKLVTQHVADYLGISRTPIREAFARLEEKGVVVRSANQGYFLQTFTFHKVRDLFEARRIIEVANTELAALRATEKNVEIMNEILNKCLNAVKKNDINKFQKLARNFHREIAVSSGNTQLLIMFDQINDLVLLFGLTLIDASPKRVKEILKENKEILNSIISGDQSKAHAAITKHLTAGHEHFVNSFITSNLKNNRRD